MCLSETMVQVELKLLVKNDYLRFFVKKNFRFKIIPKYIASEGEQFTWEKQTSENETIQVQNLPTQIDLLTLDNLIHKKIEITFQRLCFFFGILLNRNFISTKTE